MLEKVSQQNLSSAGKKVIAAKCEDQLQLITCTLVRPSLIHCLGKVRLSPAKVHSAFRQPGVAGQYAHECTYS